MKMKYAGIGSRETPAEILELMRRLGIRMAQLGHVLRSGAADGADSAFESGCDQAGGTKEIYLPWNGFNKRSTRETGVFIGFNDFTEELAAKHHPNWSACSNGAKALHSRNVCQVLGLSRESPSDLVICWTKGGTGAGGTGQAIRIARAHSIPVFDFGKDGVIAELAEFINARKD